jgi:TPR repeat protein
MYCRGQRSAEEEEWTQPKFKEQHKIRELFEYRVEQMTSELTKTKVYFTELLHECRKQDTTDAHLTLGFLYQHGYGIRRITSRAIEFYTLAAEKENVDAQYNLASIYHAHHDMKWNYREAFKWYTKAAKNGSIYAQSGLAFLYQHGLGVNISYKKTIHCYTQAAEMRNVKAHISLGCVFRKGEIVDQDLVKATEWYKRAAKEGSQVAQNCLDLLSSNSNILSNSEADLSLKEKAPELYSKKGLCSRLRNDVDAITVPATLKSFERLASNAMKKDGNAMLEIGLNYYHGTQFQQDKDTAFRWIRKAAKAGLIKAQLLIAEMYNDGDCVQQDYLKSSIWRNKTAKQGDSTSQYQLGQLYYQGLGVRKDPLEASRQYTFAAENKHADAQYQLGYLREKGDGLRQDVLEAIQIYTDLSKLKYPEALHRLAILYESGNGVEPNFEQALLLYKKAAYLGCLNAQLILGQLYSDRNNSLFSAENAFKYFKMAANQNHSEAKYRLAILYLDGRGVERDFIQAYKLFNESRDLHCEDAENIFHVPINYGKNDDIDYDKIASMFTLVCRDDLGDLDYNLGFYYEHKAAYEYEESSCRKKPDLDLAKTWYEAAASKNNSKAMYRLGLMYETGKGVRQDWKVAVDYYKKARNAGNTEATYKFAHLCLNGNGVYQNFRRALYLFMEASYKDPGEVVGLLSEWYEATKDNIPLDLKKVLIEIAENGNIAIQYSLGVLYTKKSPPTSNSILNGIKWLSGASKGGHIGASYRLAKLLEEVKITNHYESVDSLYQRAGDKGHEYALYRLAQLNHYGNGVKPDYLKSFELYTTAANYGHPLAKLATKITCKSTWEYAKNKLKNRFKYIALDYDSCLQMWERVGNHRNTELQYQLGNAYEKMGSGSDLVKANRWYSKATKRSHGPSLFRLGRLFELGLGAKQDYKKAMDCTINWL